MIEAKIKKAMVFFKKEDALGAPARGGWHRLFMDMRYDTPQLIRTN